MIGNLLTKSLARTLILTAEVVSLRALVKLQGEALEKSTKRADRLAGELERTRAELRDAVAEITITQRAHAEERNRWAVRVNELTTEAESFAVSNAELRKINEASHTTIRMRERERDHWKAAARAAGANVEGELDPLVASS